MTINDEVSTMRRESLLKEISGRLGPVCAHFPDADFATLVGTIADRQLAGEARVKDLAIFRMQTKSSGRP
ncbi:MAG: hypothetical protein ACR2GK_11830 [Gemmatimonadaceae bacterium]